ncbi:MAG: CBS domain-containing protein, partial [Flavobacteriia bacterium]|nr:CBS domain-containing protein [Flavobacteriia bacterium]
ASISSVMGVPFPVVQAQTSLEDLCKLINKDTPAVLVELADGKAHIVTRYDIISAMA